MQEETKKVIRELVEMRKFIAEFEGLEKKYSAALEVCKKIACWDMGDWRSGELESIIEAGKSVVKEENAS